VYRQRDQVVNPVEYKLVVKNTDCHAGHAIGEQENISKHDLVFRHEVDKQ
jgi:hypothetical protein